MEENGIRFVKVREDMSATYGASFRRMTPREAFERAITRGWRFLRGRYFEKENGSCAGCMVGALLFGALEYPEQEAELHRLKFSADPEWLKFVFPELDTQALDDYFEDSDLDEPRSAAAQSELDALENAFVHAAGVQNSDPVGDWFKVERQTNADAASQRAIAELDEGRFELNPEVHEGGGEVEPQG